MRSLEAFIEENGQWERAAQRLYCHRHTLRYRIRRVEELTGRDLHSARDRIEFWLALRGSGARVMKVGCPHRGQDRTSTASRSPPPACASSSMPAMRSTSRAAPDVGSAIDDDAITWPRARTIVPDADAVFAAAELIVKVKEPQPDEVARLEPRHTLFTYLHLAADAELTRGADGLGRHLHRLRDRRGRPRPAAAACADVRGGRQDRHPGRGLHAREAARRPGHPARRRARRGGRQRDCHRRRGGRDERRLHRARHGGDGVRLSTATSTACASSTSPSAAAPTRASPPRSRSSSACRTPTW